MVVQIRLTLTMKPCLFFGATNNASDEKVHSRMEFFTILQPQHLNSDGLYHSLLDGIQSLGISASDAPTCKN